MGDGLDYFQQRKQNKHLAKLNEQTAAGDSEQVGFLSALLYEAQRTNALLTELLRQTPKA